MRGQAVCFNVCPTSLLLQVRFAAVDRCRHLEVVESLLSSSGRAVQICRLPENSVMDRLMAQSALQPGVLQLFQSIMSFKQDVGFRWLPVPESKTADKAWSYGEIRRRFHHCLPVGYVGSNTVHLNPHDTSKVLPGDRMIVLQKGEGKFENILSFFNGGELHTVLCSQASRNSQSSAAAPGFSARLQCSGPNALRADQFWSRHLQVCSSRGGRWKNWMTSCRALRYLPFCICCLFISDTV